MGKTLTAADDKSFTDEMDEADTLFRQTIKTVCEQSKSMEEEQRRIGIATSMHSAACRMIVIRLLHKLLAPNPNGRT